jgi:subtilisin-like proprotein convertase family protein
VYLLAPDGTSVLLHNRAGGSRDNLEERYTLANAPGLAALQNLRISGDWVLHVQDLANRDVGILDRWELELGVSAEPLLVEDSTSERIPDQDPAGITRRLKLPGGYKIGDIAVSIDITHSWIGDLRVTLITPNETAIRLHDRAGGRADNLERTWQSQDFAPLRSLRGQDTGGTWQLHVADLVRRDEGKLNRWKIEILEQKPG